jgi:hypothetical protein
MMNIFMSIFVIFDHSPNPNADENKAFAEFITRRIAALEEGQEFLRTILNQGPVTIHIEAKDIKEGSRGLHSKWNHKKREATVGHSNYAAFLRQDPESMYEFLFLQTLDALSIAISPELSPENIPNVLNYANITSFLIDMSQKEYKAYYTRAVMSDRNYRFRFGQNPPSSLSQTMTYERYYKEVFHVTPHNNMLSLSDYYENIYTNSINKHKLSIQQWLNTINDPRDNLKKIITHINTHPLTEQDKSAFHQKAHVIWVAEDNIYRMMNEIQRIGSPEAQAFFSVNELRSFALTVKEEAQTVMSFMQSRTNREELAVGRASLLPAVTINPTPTLPSVAPSSSGQATSLPSLNPYLFFESNFAETVVLRPSLGDGQASSEIPILTTGGISNPYS